MNINEIKDYLKNYSAQPIRLMEVCGTHTASIVENGIESLISNKIRLISGPGCPVCVTVSSYIDRLCELSMQKNNVIVTFGDMIRVPGSKCSLAQAKSCGADVRMVYSPLETVELAENEPSKTFIFAAVGFETTTPVYAIMLQSALQREIKNIKFLTALKTMPAVIDKLCENGADIDGFIAPGHVAVITGSDAFKPLAEKYFKPFVVSGFTGEEILASVYALVKLINSNGRAKVVNLYTSAVKKEKNAKAYSLVNKFFEPCTASWRGLGEIENSGLALRTEYSLFDAGSRDLNKDSALLSGCICSDVVTGRKAPGECPLFSKKCTPSTPVGACMVSGEGACFNYYSQR